MKIGFDAKRAFRNYTGLGNYSRTVLENLAGFYPDHEYFLYTPSGTAGREVIPGKGNNIHIRLPGGIAATMPSLWRSFLLRKDLMRDGIELYHGLSNELPAGIEKTCIKSVVTIHDLIFLRFPSLYPPVDRLIYKKKFTHACRVADTVIAISQQTKDDITGLLGIEPSRVHVLYQSCADIFQNPCTAEKREEVRKKYSLPPEFILNVGTVEERKNLLTLVKALEIAGAGVVSPPLVVVGKSTPYKTLVQQYIHDRRMDGKVLFLEDVAFVDLPAIYQLAALFVYPSRYEGFGIPVIEALSSGTPVITTRGGCLQEAGGADSLYVGPDDPEELAEAILRILGDEALMQRMSGKGKEHVQQFHKSTVTGKLMELYHHTLTH
jgi:glycosyltransferase involved in cell wall biosynthesis